MNNIINKFLLAGDKFMPEMHLRQPRFVYSACGAFTRHKERIKEFKRTRDTRYIYRNELDKACFQHDSQYKDNIWGVDLADMQSLSRENKGIKYLLCAIDLYSKYAIVIPLKDKKEISVVNAFDKIIKQSNRKPNKIWVDQGSELYNNNFDNDIIMYSMYNEGISVVAERFIRTLKNRLFEHMTATGKNIYYDVLDGVVNKYNNTKHGTIKMKPIDVKHNKRVYIDEHNEKDSRFKVGDRVRMSKFKNIFAKGYTPNWSKEIFIVDKINDTVPYTYNLKDLNDEEIIGSFYDRELQKSIL